MFHRMSDVVMSLNNNLLSRYPKIYSVSDFTGRSTAGTGDSALARISALGEHLERFVFRHLSSCIPASQSTNGVLCDEWNWMDVLSQLAGRVVENDEVRKLKLIRTWSFTTSRECFVPSVLVSLEGLSDHTLFPSADTTGCAVHTDPQRCVDNAILEFCERQCAFASWYGPWSTTEITLSAASSERMDVISSLGHVRLFDIGVPMGVPVLLSIFVNRRSSNPVKFAAGLGAAWNRGDAVRKSLHELYQLYELTHFSATGEIPDSNDLLQHNRQETAAEWSFIAKQQSDEVSDQAYLATETLPKSHLLERLEGLGIRLLLFLDRVGLPGTRLYAAKALSPDAFLSSMGKEHNNYDNRFCSTCSIKSDRSRPCILF